VPRPKKKGPRFRVLPESEARRLLALDVKLAEAGDAAHEIERVFGCFHAREKKQYQIRLLAECRASVRAARKTLHQFVGEAHWGVPGGRLLTPLQSSLPPTIPGSMADPWAVYLENIRLRAEIGALRKLVMARMRVGYPAELR